MKKPMTPATTPPPEDDMAQAQREDAPRTAGALEQEKAALKPCPFCGGPAMVHSHYEAAGGWDVNPVYWVTCDATKPGHCAAAVGVPVSNRQSEDEAIAAWNRRAAAEPVPCSPHPDVRGLVEALELCRQQATPSSGLSPNSTTIEFMDQLDLIATTAAKALASHRPAGEKEKA